MTQQKLIIVGAAGGIGNAVCEMLAEQGGVAHLIGRDEGKISAAATKFGWTHSAADASDWDQLDAACSEGREALGEVTGVVNLAGSVLLKPAHLTSRADWDSTVSQNLTTAFGLLRCMATKMVDAGSVVLMSSAAANIGLSNHEAIAACKAGIEGLVRSAATTYAAKKVRVNGVAPGLVKTPLTERIWSQERAAAASTSLHPVGRLGEPADIASAILWLTDLRQSWVTGQTIGVDGGLGTLKTMS
jgi:NAD(P)-dependent dehydrogenase (short-subunit alcohol dehydrogenase family)